jgi:hypothetical protein
MLGGRLVRAVYLNLRRGCIVDKVIDRMNDKGGNQLNKDRFPSVAANA